MKNCYLLASILLLASCNVNQKDNYARWDEYLGGADRNHFSTLNQIDTNNVKQLKVAWIYESPDTGQVQVNTIIVNGLLYGVTAGLKAYALNAETGKQIWIYKDSASSNGITRGLAYWENGEDKRVFYTVGANLIALNALDGKPITSFGVKGKLNLHTGLPAAAKDKYITSTTPGTIYKNLIIMSVRVAEDAGAAPGHVRAFDVRTGKLVWTFHTIPQPGEKGYETWSKDAYKNINVGAVNNWAGMALDKKTGIIFIPLGSAAPDFYGVNRIGTNLYANCLLALNADDGSYKWHYQMVHHDLWDRDPPAPPNLITVIKNGQPIDAIAQITKQGYTFVLDRNTGKSLFNVTEIDVPASKIPGEQAWLTQPVPDKPKPFARAAWQLTENSLSPFANNKEELKKILLAADKRLFAPVDTFNMLLMPGYDGGAEYGGAAADPGHGILYVNANEMAWFLKLDKQPEHASSGSQSNLLSAGQQIYNSYCSGCHGKDLKGNMASGYPALNNIAQNKTAQYVHQIISNGKGMMPAFSAVSKQDQQRVVDYLFKAEKKELLSATVNTGVQDTYKHAGYQKFLDDKGLPAIAPPWGTLTAIDLNTGNHLWQIPLGITPGLPDQDINPTGCENYGGSIVTENGLLFIAATKDGMFRAFNRFTGKLLWKVQLPAASFATPSMYSINGKQYIVLACGGEKLGTPKGNKVIAFALP